MVVGLLDEKPDMHTIGLGITTMMLESLGGWVVLFHTILAPSFVTT